MTAEDPDKKKNSGCCGCMDRVQHAIVGGLESLFDRYGRFAAR